MVTTMRKNRKPQKALDALFRAQALVYRDEDLENMADSHPVREKQAAAESELHRRAWEIPSRRKGVRIRARAF